MVFFCLPIPQCIAKYSNAMSSILLFLYIEIRFTEFSGRYIYSISTVYLNNLSKIVWPVKESISSENTDMILNLNFYFVFLGWRRAWLHSWSNASRYCHSEGWTKNRIPYMVRELIILIWFLKVTSLHFAV